MPHYPIKQRKRLRGEFNSDHVAMAIKQYRRRNEPQINITEKEGSYEWSLDFFDLGANVPYAVFRHHEEYDVNPVVWYCVFTFDKFKDERMWCLAPKAMRITLANSKNEQSLADHFTESDTIAWQFWLLSKLLG